MLGKAFKCCTRRKQGDVGPKDPPPKVDNRHPLVIRAEALQKLMESQNSQGQEEITSPPSVISQDLLQSPEKADENHPLATSAESQQGSNNSQDQGIITGPPGIDSTITHPVYQKYGEQAYNLHAFIEHFLGTASCQASLNLNPQLKLQEKGNPPEDPFLWTPQEFKRYLQKENIQQGSLKEQVKYLYEVFGRLSTHDYDKKGILEKDVTAFKEEVSNMIGDCLSRSSPSEMQFLKKNIFIFEAVLPYIQENHLDAILNLILRDITYTCNKANLNNDKELLSEIALLENLLSKDKRVVKSFVNNKNYLPNLNDPNFETNTIFGSFLSLTAFPEEFQIEALFQHHIKDMKSPRKIQNHLRKQISQPIDGVYRIMKIIMKADPAYKKYITDWMYLFLEGYQARFKTNSIANKGRFMNFLMLLLEFSQDPLKDPLKWLSRVDIRYLQEKPIFEGMILFNGFPNIHVLNPSEIPYSFFTELVFILSHALEQFLKLIELFDKMTHQLLLDTDTRYLLKITNYNVRFGFEVHLDDSLLLERILKFLTFQTLYFLQSFDIPIADIQSVPQIFTLTKNLKKIDFESRPTLPINWINNILDLTLYLKNADRDMFVLQAYHSEILMDFPLSIISNSQWIETFNLKSKALSLMRALTLSKDDFPSEPFASFYGFNPFYMENFLQSLLQLFIDVEKNVIKHSVRTECCRLLSYIFREKHFADKNLSGFNKLNKENPDLLLKFGMLYVADLSFLFDESLQRMGQIKSFQSNQTGQNSYEAFLDGQSSLMVNLETVFSYLFVFQKYYEMGSWLTQFPVEFLLSSELRDLYTSNLNYTRHILLKSFATSSLNNQPIYQRNNENFHPMILLKFVLKIYLNLYRRNGFLESVVSDARSFDIKEFLLIPDTCQKNKLLNNEGLEEWKILIKKLEQKAQEKEQADKLFLESVGEIPEEFMDPLVNEVMKDPVMLPSSKMIVDRTTIIKYMLNDPIDPFNRSPLTKDMLVPVPELKEKIQEFFKSKQ